MPNRDTTERVAPPPGVMREEHVGHLRRLPVQDSALLRDDPVQEQTSGGLSRGVLKALIEANDLADGLGHKSTGVGHLLMALLQSEAAGIEAFLRAHGLRSESALGDLISRIEPSKGEII